MLLCDIGNTSYHFFNGTTDYKERVEYFDPLECEEDVYYINVNSNVQNSLKSAKNWHDLSLHVTWEKYYESMGIDRVMACEAVEDGIIVDAGSAITVDCMAHGVHQGGFIYPGVAAMHDAYVSLSNRLDYPFNFDLDLGKMPKNSQDAISYGFLAPLKAAVDALEGPLVLTGGDALRLRDTLFSEAKVEPLLLFRGMQKIIEKGKIC
jgi:type III pantothenate kinase